jgi:hypothetical protein
MSPCHARGTLSRTCHDLVMHVAMSPSQSIGFGAVESNEGLGPDLVRRRPQSPREVRVPQSAFRLTTQRQVKEASVFSWRQWCTPCTIELRFTWRTQ